MSGHQSRALLCRFRCRLLLAEIRKIVDKNSELKQRLHLWESGQITGLISKVLGQQNSGPPRKTARGMKPQTNEQRGKRACALTARGCISKAMRDSSVAPRRALRTAGGTGPQPSSRGVRAQELIPPWRSVPRRPGSPGEEGDTNWRGAR